MNGGRDLIHALKEACRHEERNKVFACGGTHFLWPTVAPLPPG